MSYAPNRPIIVKTCRSKVAVIGGGAILLSIGVLIKVADGSSTKIDQVLMTVCALALTGASLYLFAIAIFRPVLLRMDSDGISGYYAPPVKWEDVGEIAVYRQEVRRSPFDLVYAGIKLSRSGAMLGTVSRGRYEKALRNCRRSGFHILVPQIMMKDLDAEAVVSYARAYQGANRDATRTSSTHPPTTK